MKAWTKTRVQAVFACRAQERVEVFLVRVNAAIGDQAEEMQLAAAFARALHGLHDGGVFLKFAGGDHARRCG